MLRYLAKFSTKLDEQEKITMQQLTKILLQNKDEVYKKFNATLLPNINAKTIIGVRMPILRKIANEFFTPENANEFFKEVPHKYFEENQIHMLLITKICDFKTCLQELQNFLPYVDNWSVCDAKFPNALLQNPRKFYENICNWLKSNNVYTMRFAINMLMNFFIEERFSKKHLQLVAAINLQQFDGSYNTTQEQTDYYYAQMAVAWYFATALAKQWDNAIPFIKNKILDAKTHNKIIQKAYESFRISSEHKNILRTLKV